MSAKLVLIFALCLASLHAYKISELCEDGKGKFDVIISTPDNAVYVIKGTMIWRLIGDKDSGFHLDKNGFPKPVSAVFPGLPSHLDAGYTNYQSCLTYFFKENRVWVYKDYRLQSGYPKAISREVTNLPGAIDGAFVCTGVNYYFKGNHVYSGPSGSPAAKIGRKWSGLPDNMHAAIQFPSRGHTFFFKDHQFYKYRVYNGPVEAGYPKNVVPFWFQCEEPVTQASNEDYNEPEGEIDVRET